MVCKVCYKYVTFCYKQIIFPVTSFVNKNKGIHKLLIIQAKITSFVAKMRRSPQETPHMFT